MNNDDPERVSDDDEPYEGITSEVRPLINMVKTQVFIGGLSALFSIYANFRMGFPGGVKGFVGNFWLFFFIGFLVTPYLQLNTIIQQYKNREVDGAFPNKISGGRWEVLWFFGLIVLASIFIIFAAWYFPDLFM